MELLLAAFGLQVLAGFAALLCSRSPNAATALGAGGAVLASLLGLAPALRVLLGGPAEFLTFAWDATHGPFKVEIDALSAFFLLPVLGLSALAAVYGGQYLLAYRKKKTLGAPWFFFNLFVAGMGMVLVARTILLFLVAWEVMSIAAYCLVTFQHEKSEVRQAGWIYLVATHLGVAFLLLAFFLLARGAGSQEFDRIHAATGPGAVAAGVIFVLALVGFGAKAGLVPFHVWLPEAHPAAPSHVSALMSGVMIKIGLYGLLRILTFLGPPAPWWGIVLAGLGLLTGLVGIALATFQRDVKRVLAYSSIENMGLIVLGLGVSLWGQASNQPVVAVLGMTAVLLHIWNHAVMKGLMFLAAGSIMHAAGTRDMEKLGGLMSRMPWTAASMMAGAVAITALPPLNGFVSKWLLYMSLLQTGLASNDSLGLLALFAVGLLAAIGGLAVVTFVRLSGIVLLGSPRSETAQRAHESSAWLLGPIHVLVLLCLVAAVLPGTVADILVWPLAQVSGLSAGAMLQNLEDLKGPLIRIGLANAWTWAALSVGGILFLAWTRRRTRATGPTWGCGYVNPTARMQYTGRSFTEMIADSLLPRFLRPQSSRHGPSGLFPGKGEFGTACQDPFNEKAYQPILHRWADQFSRLRILQQGQVHIYLAYIVFMVVMALAWVSLRTWWTES